MRLHETPLLPAVAIDEASQESGWSAELALAFAPRPSRTVLCGVRHRGPLRVQRPFYPQGDGTCHVYLLHPPGGLVGGDQLSVEVDVATGARALVTTPAAGKFYRSEQRTARQLQRCRIAAGGALEWLPQENIFFSGSWSEVTTAVELTGDARFAGWDVTALGRPAAGERFATGRVRQRFELWRDGAPLWLERGVYDGGGDVLGATWGLGGATAIGVLVAVGVDAALLPALRDALDAALPGGRHGLTLRGDVLIGRALAATAEDVRRGLAAVWMTMRPAWLGSPAVPPRVWAT
jgi:urease accessory protein